MGKRNRKKKYKIQQAIAQSRTTVLQQTVTEAAVSVQSPAKQAMIAKVNEATNVAYSAHAKEYNQVQKDLLKVLLVNGTLLLLTLTLYFVNRSNGFLDNLYSKLF